MGKNLEKKTKIQQAKKRILGGEDGPKEPKRPPSAYFIFVKEKRSSTSGAFKEVSQQLTQMWSKLSDDEKKEYETKAAELKEEYDKEMEEYKSSDSFKKFEKTVKGISGRGKPKKKAAPKSKGKDKKEKGKGKEKEKKKSGRGRGKKAEKKKAESESEKADSDSDVM